MKEKTRFGALGAVLAAAGSAVGLGNIWKFPYMTGENGGGAFLLIYLACILLFGIPILSAEFYAGRRGYGRWRWLEPVALLSATLFCGFYFVITGWCFHYLILSVTGATSALSPAALSEVFGGVTGEVLMPCFCIVLAVLITAFITVAGIKSGIERASKILMPLLFIIIIALIIYGLTLPGNREGLRFLFAPDFSKITPTLTINALSQCFFTLSLGMAVMANYASFMEPSQNLTRTAMQVAGLDTAVAVLAGLAIFPAVFSLGIDPTQGPELVFVTLPSAFNHIAGGYWLQILFFLLMVIAAITTTISIVQTQEYWLETHTRLSRRWATCIAALIDLLLALLCCLSLTTQCADYLTIAGMSLYDAADWLVSKILFPAGGILFSLYVGWICEPADVVKELSIGGKRAIGKTLLMLIRYVIPLVLIIIVIFGFLA